MTNFSSKKRPRITGIFTGRQSLTVSRKQSAGKYDELCLFDIQFKFHGGINEKNSKCLLCVVVKMAGIDVFDMNAPQTNHKAI